MPCRRTVTVRLTGSTAGRAPSLPTTWARSKTCVVRHGERGVLRKRKEAGVVDGAAPGRPLSATSIDPEWRRVWDAELQARIASIDAGTAQWVSLDEARARLRAAAERR